jgi:hypothetical protein
MPLALLSLPALAITYKIDPKRLGFVNPPPDQSSPFTMIALRLALARDINLPSTRRKIYVFGLPRIVLQ